MDQFGLGIQVFKIESKKQVDHNRTKNKSHYRQIETMKQHFKVPNPKQPLVARPKYLPSLDNNNNVSEAIKTNSTGFSRKNLNDKSICSAKGLSGQKVLGSRTPEKFSLNRISTPLSLSKQKKVSGVGGAIQQKKVTNFVSNSIKERPQLKVKKAVEELNQPQVVEKAPQTTYLHTNQELNRISNFYTDLESAYKSNLKEAKALRKLKENERCQDTIENIGYLQSPIGAINKILENQDKERFKRMKESNSGVGNKNDNSIIPVMGFEANDYPETSQQINNYILNGFSGYFKKQNYEDVDLMPSTAEQDE